MRRRRWFVAVAVALVVAVGVTIGVRSLLHEVNPPPPACRVGNGPEALYLDTEQAANATTITAVAHRMGLPNHAVTVAIATVLQESKMHNLPYGDRDSLGLFQQRPSQGWGTPAQLLTPAFAAQAFYRHLVRVDGWERLPVALAAQDVQHSADGSGYEAWVEEARAIARALTGEVTGQFSCRFSSGGRPAPRRLSRLAGLELGRGALTASGTAADDWLAAQWLVGHAYQLGLQSVTVRGERWQSGDFGWTRDSAAGDRPAWVLSRR
ncbi:MAG TPA: hypothetical protein VFH66_16185 [Mycobacteriales bacterium]|nr:hypothetical protein [Mycobacteriales bacterium]